MAGDRGDFSILIVDDSPTSRLKLAAAVRHLGHDVEEADSGESGLESLRGGNIDLVLLDIVMPDIDGYEVLRRMSRDPDLSEIPVLVISSLEDMKEIVEAIELGAVDFLPKNVDPSLLKARVSACLEKKRLRDLELEYLKDVNHLTEAARIVREYDFNPARLPLDTVSQRKDPLGDLARIFTHMAGEVHRREIAYRRQIDLLRGGFILILIGAMTGLYPALSRILAANSIDNPLGTSAWVALATMAVSSIGLSFTGTLPKFTWSKLRFALVIGPFSAAFPQIALFYATEHIPGIVMSIILAMQALMVFLITTLLGIEKPSFVRLGGLVMGLIAVAVILQPSSSGVGIASPIWIFVALLVPFFYGLEGILMVAMPTEKISAWELAFFTMLGSAIWAWSLAVAFGMTLPVADIDQTTGFIIVAFAAISGVGTWLLAVAVRKTGAVFASQYSYVTTVMGVIWSILILSETASVWIWVSLGCMLIGMVLVRPKENDDDVPKESIERKVDRAVQA